MKKQKGRLSLFQVDDFIGPIIISSIIIACGDLSVPCFFKGSALSLT